MDKDRHNRVDVENQIIENLLKRAKLTLPETFVKKQLERRFEESKQRLKEKGLSDEDIDIIIDKSFKALNLDKKIDMIIDEYVDEIKEENKNLGV